MKFLYRIDQHDTCEKCGSAILHGFVFLNDQGIRVKIGMDCTVKQFFGGKKNVLSRWVENRERVIASNRNWLETKDAEQGFNFRLFPDKGTLRLFPKKQSWDFGKTFKIDYLRTHFPEIATKYAI